MKAPPIKLKGHDDDDDSGKGATACVLRLDEIMSCERSPESRRPRSTQRKRPSFMLMPSSLTAFEDSSPSPTDVPGSRLSLSGCDESPVPHRKKGLTKGVDDALFDDMATSFNALALGPDSVAHKHQSSGSDEAGRQSTQPQEDSFFSDAGHDCDQPFEIRTITECMAQEESHHHPPYALDSPLQTSNLPPVTDSGSRHSCSSRISTEQVVATFETPTVIKRLPRPIPREHDWGLSTTAPKLVLENLAQRLDRLIENVRESLGEDAHLTMMERVKILESCEGLLPPPHMRYAPMSTETTSSFALDILQAGPPLPGRKSGKHAELRRKQSVAKARRVSIGLQARAAHQVPMRPRPTTDLSLAPIQDISTDGRSSLSKEGALDGSAQEVIYGGMGPCIQALDRTTLVRIFSFLSLHEIGTVLPFTCKQWLEPSIHAHADLLSQLSKLSEGVSRSWDWLVKSLPCGVFLSDGAYKTVFKASPSHLY